MDAWTVGTFLFLWTSVVCAQADSNAAHAELRAKAVTQVVLGILSYARWPVEPAQLRLCLVGPTEYADDLLKGSTQSTGRPVVVRRL
ncbi:YfiR family protein, partial [Pseudomonas laurentiana]|nr:YfiR family protein [Pseudomonas laurentiana]